MTRLRVAAMSPFVPYPGIDHAGGAFLFDYLSALSRSADITLWAPATDLNRAKLDHAPVEVRLLGLPALSPHLVRKVDAALRAPSPGRDMMRAFTASEELRSALAESQIAELHWGHLLALVPWARRVAGRPPIAVHGHDVIAQSEARLAAGIDNPFVSAARRNHNRRLGRRESAYLNGCDVGYYFSPDDVQLLRTMGVRTPLRLLDPKLELPPATRSTDETPPEVLFVGALQRVENAAGVQWFLQSVWPQIRARVPDARLVVAGANPPDEIRAAASDAITVTGFVPDLVPYFARASVFVAPLLAGAGLKFKVAQAMLFGLPIVSTTIGAEGFDRDALAAVTNEPQAFADAVVQLLTSPDERATKGEAGRRWAASRFSFDTGIRSVLADYELLAAGESLTADSAS